MAEPDARDALRQKLEERDKARAALVEVVQEEDQRIAQLREKRAQDREMRRKEHEAATQLPPAQPPKPRRRRRKPVSDVEDARRQEKERTAAEEAEKAPPPDPRDAERRELWKELGAYGDSLRERVDFRRITMRWCNSCPGTIFTQGGDVVRGRTSGRRLLEVRESLR